MADQLSLSEIDTCIAELRDHTRYMTEAAAADGDFAGDCIEHASIELEELMRRRDAVLAGARM
jgi:hypothetical protein